MSQAERELEKRIRERAYFLWENGGRPQTSPDEFWHKAELEEIAERSVPEFIATANLLSAEEYGVSLEQLLADMDTERGVLRYGRLLGVMLKEPFADVCIRRNPSTRTGALRDWEWPEEEIRPQQIWQYYMLEYLAGRFGYDVSEFVLYYGAHESDIAKILLRVITEHVCGDPEAKARITAAIESAKQQGYSIINPMNLGLATSLSGLVASSVAVALGPIGIAIAPVVGGITLWLMSVGVETFCRLAHRHQSGIEC